MKFYRYPTPPALSLSVALHFGLLLIVFFFPYFFLKPRLEPVELVLFTPDLQEIPSKNIPLADEALPANDSIKNDQAAPEPEPVPKTPQQPEQSEQAAVISKPPPEPEQSKQAAVISKPPPEPEPKKNTVAKSVVQPKPIPKKEKPVPIAPPKITLEAKKADDILRAPSAIVADQGTNNDVAGISASRVTPSIAGGKATSDEVEKYLIPATPQLNDAKGTEPQTSTSSLQPKRGQESLELDRALYDYQQQLIKKIEAHWRPWKGETMSRFPVVLAEIAKNGELLKVQIETRSSSSLFDTAAINAVKLAAPFPPYPKVFPANKIFRVPIRFKNTEVLF